MHPLLFGPIHSYGVMLAIAFAVGTFYLYNESKRAGLDPEKILDLAIWIMVSAIIGARILFVLSDFGYYIEHPLEIMFSRAGFSSYGGMIMALAMGIWFCKRNLLPVWKVADIVMPGVALGEVFGRIGCFLNGCCYGKPANPLYIKWAVKFPYLDGYKVENPVYRHPTQLYQSLFALLIFILLHSLNKRKKFDGETFWTYLVVYSVIRFIIDMYREPGQDWMISQFTIAQIISLVIFAFSIGILIRFRSLNIHNPGGKSKE